MSRSSILGLLLIALCAAWSSVRSYSQASAGKELLPDQVSPWMLETVRGIGPKTAASTLDAYHKQGFEGLNPGVQATLRGLIQDIPAPEIERNTAQ